MLGKLADSLAGLAEWNHDACEHALRGIAEAEGVKAGLLINATRVAIVGQAVAPPLFETMLVLGRERVVRRLRAALPVMDESAKAAGECNSLDRYFVAELLGEDAAHHFRKCFAGFFQRESLLSV